MFWIPEEKMKKLVLLISAILKKGVSNFVELEKIVGKCRSMSIAVPAAALYTRAQYKTLKEEERPHKSGETKSIYIVGELKEELEMWLKLATKLNGATWRKPSNIRLTVQGFSDSSSRRTAGVFTTPEQNNLCVQKN